MSNLDKADPNIFLDIGGRKRQLLYTLHSDKQLKRLTGRSLLKGIQADDPDFVAALVWAGLIETHKEFDGKIDQGGNPDQAIEAAIRQISSWIDFRRLSEIASIIGQAVEQAAPPQKEAGGQEQKKEQAES